MKRKPGIGQIEYAYHQRDKSYTQPCKQDWDIEWHKSAPVKNTDYRVEVTFAAIASLQPSTVLMQLSVDFFRKLPRDAVDRCEFIHARISDTAQAAETRE